MHATRATVRNGRIEPIDPVDLPDGTELILFGREVTGSWDEPSDDSPAVVAAWLRWYDSLEPLVFTTQERQAWDEERAARNRWELAHADARADRLRDMWR